MSTIGLLFRRHPGVRIRSEILHRFRCQQMLEQSDTANFEQIKVSLFNTNLYL